MRAWAAFFLACLVLDVVLPAPVRVHVVRTLAQVDDGAATATESQDAPPAGSLDGEFSVDNSMGSAAYEIPIRVPPGTAGMQPEVKLAFNSRGGAGGLLGKDWSVKGLSAVHRCPRSYATDGFSQPIMYDAADALCLDGNRLVLVNGTTYGGDGSVYRTETETFAKVVSHGSSGSGPAWFEAWTRDGHHAVYGKSADSRVLALGASEVRVWAMCSVDDRASNYMQFQYEQPADTGDYRIQRIDYTGNERAGMEPYNSVEFAYEDRPDVVPVLSGGYPIITRERLASIATFAEGALVQRYELSYDVSCTGATSLLKSVQLCAGASGACLPPTTFTWDSSCGGTFASKDATHPDTAVAGSLSMASLDLSRVQFGDFDGNGLSDVYVVQGFGGSAPEAGAIYLQYFDHHYEQVAAPAFPVAGYIEGAERDIARIRLVDMNSDGRTDIYYIEGSFGGASVEDSVYLSNGDGTFTKCAGPKTSVFQTGPAGTQLESFDLSRVRIADMNGDSLPDVYVVLGWGAESTEDQVFLSVDVESGEYEQVAGGAFPVSSSLAMARLDLARMQLLDITGDGCADVYYVTGYGETVPDEIYVGDCDGGFRKSDANGPSTSVGGWIERASLDISRVQFADVNGDGFPDMYYVRGGPGFTTNVDAVYWNRGDGTFDTESVDSGADTPVSTLASMAGLDMQRINILDVNADGYADVYYVNGLGSDEVDTLFLGRGDGTFTRVAGAPTFVSGTSALASLDLSRLHFMDWDGNGMADVFRVNGFGDAPTTDQVFYNPTRRASMVHVVDGLGAETRLTYLPATVPAVYTLEPAAASFPLRPFFGPTPLVAAVREKASDGEWDQTDYKYGGGQDHLQGFGFLGFREATTTRRKTGASTWTRFSHDYAQRLQYHALESEARVGNAVTERAVFDWKVREYRGVGGTRYLTYVEREVHEQYDLDGSWLGNSTTENLDMDDFGSFQRVLNNVRDEYGWYNSTTSNAFVNAASDDSSGPWVIGVVLTSNKTSSVSGQPPVTKHTAFSYTEEWLLRSECIEPESPIFRLSTEYELDAFGNRKATTVSGADIETRTTSEAEYDERGRFVIASRNALGHGTSATYDAAHGGVLTQTDVNELTTSTTYDAFGRVSRVQHPDGTTVDTGLFWCKDAKTLGDPQCSPSGVVYSRVVDSAGVPSWSQSDARGRGTRHVSVAFNGSLVCADTQYTAVGNVLQSSEAYFCDASGAPAHGAAVYWTRYEYDALNRETAVHHVDDSVSRVEYHGLKVIFSNALKQQHIKYANALGQDVRVVDHTGNETTYTYDASGNRIGLVDAEGNAMTWAFDVLNHVVEQRDPDAGLMQVKSDVLGNVVWTKDALGQEISREYDLLGRAVSETRPDGRSRWQYDTAQHGVGLLANATNSEGVQVSVAYDRYSRVSASSTRVDEEEFVEHTEYDELGRPSVVTYPDKMAVRTVYNEYGYAAMQQEEGGNGVVFERVDAMDSAGRVIGKTFGNGVTSQRVYNYTGTLLRIDTQDAHGGVLQQLRYEWNTLGHLTRRHDALHGLSEVITYDDMNRIATSAVGGSAAKEFSYDGSGNVLHKSDVGRYAYGENGAGPHAVSSISDGPLAGATFSYDQNGNMLTSIGRTIKYNSMNKVRSIARSGGVEMTFRYDMNGALVQQTGTNGTTTRIGGIYERITDTKGKETRRHFVGSSSICTVSADGSIADAFVLHDHLGSPDVITDMQGAVIERQSYDAFGNRRDPATWGDLPLYSTGSNTTDSGFTGQIEWYEVGLVYMNARVYDPLLGRFLSPDPTLQDPGDTQGPNRYAYVRNNPLCNTDPSGLGFLKKIGKSIGHAVKKIGHEIKRAFQKSEVLRAVVGIALSVAVGAIACGGIGALGCAASVYPIMISQASYAAVSAKVMGGSWSDAFRAAGTSLLYSAATYGVGQYFDGLNGKALKDSFGVAAGRAVAHGVVGGTFSVVQGGKFGPGFASSAFSSALSPYINDNNRPIIGITAAAILGGATSKIAGGSFATGAVQGAATFQLNQLQKKYWAVQVAGEIDGVKLSVTFFDGQIIVNPDFIQPGVGAFTGAIIYPGTYDPTLQGVSACAGDGLAGCITGTDGHVGNVGIGAGLGASEGTSWKFIVQEVKQMSSAIANSIMNAAPKYQSTMRYINKKLSMSPAPSQNSPSIPVSVIEQTSGGRLPRW